MGWQMTAPLSFSILAALPESRARGVLFTAELFFLSYWQARVSYAWGSKKQVNASWLSLQELQAFLIHWLGFTTYEQDEAPILMTSKASTGLEEVSGAATRRRSLSQSGNVLPHFGRLQGTANSEFASRFPVGQK